MTVLRGRKLGGKAWQVAMGRASAGLAAPTGDWDALTPYGQVALGWMNAGAAPLARPFVTTIHAAQRGDIPAGSHPALFTQSGTPIPTQVDLTAPAYADGSFSFGAVSALLPDTLAANGAAGDTGSYLVKAVPGPADATPKFSLAAWSAANDLRLVFRTNLADPSDDTQAFELRVADVVAAGTVEGVNTGAGYPLSSYRTDRSGPVCMGWRFRGYARRRSDGAYHRTLVGEVYVTAVSLTDMLIKARLGMPKAVETGVVNKLQTVGPLKGADFMPMLGIAELWNGATLLQTWGGPTDYRTATFAPGAVDVAANQIVFPTGGTGRSRRAMAFVFQSTGTLPPGLVANRPYWLRQDYSQERCWLMTERIFINMYDYPPLTAWTPNTAVPLWNQYGTVYVGAVPADWRTAPMWACTQAGTTGTVGPSGTAMGQADGTAQWTPINAVMTGQATGTLTAYPVVHVFPLTWAVLADTTTDPVWTGAGPAPHVEVQKDLTYFARYARAIPPYDLTVSPLYEGANAGFDGYSVGEPSVPSTLDDFGDDPGTVLIGYLNVTAANALLQQRSVPVQRAMRAEAMRWGDHWAAAEDPSSFMPVVGNNGPGNVAGTYAGLGPSLPEFYYSNAGTASRGGVFTGGGANPLAWNWYNAKYSSLDDGSHLPALWMLPYHKTGDALFLDMGFELMNANMCCIFNDAGARTLTLGARTYCATQMVFGQQRGMGWSTRCLGTINDVLPSAHPMRAYVSDCVQDAIDCALAVIADNKANHPAAYATGRMYWDGYAVQPWFVSFMLVAIAQEARKGRNPGWRQVVEHVAGNFYLRLFDDDQGGNAGLVDWCPTTCNINCQVQNVVAGDVITLSPFSVEQGANFPSEPVPAPVTYTVPAGATAASVAAGIVALVNATPALTGFDLVAVDDGNGWFHVRAPAALFDPNNHHADATLAISSPAGAVYRFYGTTNVFAFKKPDGTEFASWADAMTYNLGPNWPRTSTTYLSFVGTYQAYYGVPGWFPWGTTSYAVCAMGAIATMAEAGIPNARKVNDRMMTRIRASAAGVNFSGVVGGKLGTGTRTFNNFAIRTFADQALHASD